VSLVSSEEVDVAPSALKLSRPTARLIGTRIRELREAEGWSTNRLSENVGISFNAMKALESGDSEPSLGTLLGPCRNLQALFRGRDPRPQSAGHADRARLGRGDEPRGRCGVVRRRPLDLNHNTQRMRLGVRPVPPLSAGMRHAGTLRSPRLMWLLPRLASGRSELRRSSDSERACQRGAGRSDGTLTLCLDLT